MIKKIKTAVTVFLISILLCFQVIPANIMALEAPQLTINNVSAKPGQKFTVSLSIKNNPGIVSMKLKIGYDSTALTLTDVKDGNILGEHFHSDDYSLQPYTLSWVNDLATYNFTSDGVIAVLEFKLSNYAVAGKEYPISVSYLKDNYDIYNKDGTQVDFDLNNGAVLVNEPIYTLTVNNGTGGGQIKGGESVTVSANNAPVGKVFWRFTTIGEVQLENNKADTTTFDMPFNDLTLTAEYREDIYPNDLKLKNKSRNSVEFYKEDNVEYTCDKVNWQDSPLFTGLSANTEYTFNNRLKGIYGTSNYPAGDDTIVKTCDGNNIGTDFWEYNSDTKTLMINGSAYLKDYTENDTSREWSKYSNQAEELKVVNGGVKIGSYAFSNFTRLYRIGLWEGLETISDHAFENCSEDFYTDFPDSIKRIGESAFSHSGLMGDIDFKNVSYIGDNAFLSCPSLIKIRLTGNVNHIGSKAFGYCYYLTTALLNNKIDFIASGKGGAFEGSNAINLYCPLNSDNLEYAKTNNIKYCIYGDFDNNEKINALDIAVVKKYYLGEIDVMKVFLDFDLLDVNLDRMYNIADLVRIKKLASN